MMKLGKLDFTDVADNSGLIADPVRKMIQEKNLPGIYVSEIDSKVSDTAAFCEQYGVSKSVSANCVVIEAKVTDRVWYATCMILATDRVDVNGVVRRYLAARKVSFAPMDIAVSMTAMEYGGITPIGLPPGWPIIIDRAVAVSEELIIGSGVRKSKLLVSGTLLAMLPNAVVMDIAKAA